MTQITLTEPILTQLAAATSPVAIGDPDGHVLRTFLPGIEQDPKLYAQMRSPISDEEFERRRTEVGGLQLADFWKLMGRRK